MTGDDYPLGSVAATLARAWIKSTVTYHYMDRPDRIEPTWKCTDGGHYRFSQVMDAGAVILREGPS